MTRIGGRAARGPAAEPAALQLTTAPTIPFSRRFSESWHLLVIEEVTDRWMDRVGDEVDIKVATPREIASFRTTSAGLAYREVEIQKTHDLTELRRRLGRERGRIVVVGKVAWLRKYVLEGRYPKRPKATREHAVAAVELAKSVRVQVVRGLSPKALPET